MAVNYTMQKMNNLNREGESLMFPKMVLRGQCTIQELAKEMEKYSTFNRSEIMGILTLLSERMTARMANGYSIKLDEIGTFTPVLGLKKRSDGEIADAGKTNARCIGVSHIHFRPDKSFTLHTALQCKLKKSPLYFGCMKSPYSPGKRLEMAKDYLKRHGILTVKEYEALVKMRHTSATLELKQWSRMPESGITTHGKGSHKVYVCCEKEQEASNNTPST